MKTIKDLKQMIREPASKEWFAKHGSKKNHFPKGGGKSKALKEKLAKTGHKSFLAN